MIPELQNQTPTPWQVPAILLLAAITVFYAGYNLLVKLSGSHVPASATSTVYATICLQIGALATSVLFLCYLNIKGGQVYTLNFPAYAWAALAGICIGAAEIGYLYLFGGVGQLTPMAASTAIPVIVSGTIVITLLASALFFREVIGLNQFIGSGLIIAGIVALFLK